MKKELGSIFFILLGLANIGGGQRSNELGTMSQNSFYFFIALLRLYRIKRHFTTTVRSFIKRLTLRLYKIQLCFNI